MNLRFSGLLRLRFAAGAVFGLALVWGLPPARAAAAPPYVDRRVTALSAAALLSLPPAKLVDPRRQRVSLRLRRYNRPLFFVWAFSQIVAFFYLWSSGYAARLRDVLRRRIRSTPLLRFVYGALLALVGACATLPASLARYRVDTAYGLTAQTPLGWVRDGLLTATMDALLVGAIVTATFALVDRTRLWYLYTMAGLFAFTLLMAFLEPVLIAPLYNHVTPISNRSPVRAALERLAARAGVRNAPIEVANFSIRSRAIAADVAGFGPTKIVVLGDSLLTDATTDEVLFLTAREFGHYAHGDDFRLSLFWTFLFIACTALAVVLADRVRFRNDDDPLTRLSLVFTFLGLWALLATPLYNGYSRNLESRADAYALALTHDRVAAVRAYVRIADETFAPLCPSRPTLLYFYNSPPLGTRIAKAQQRPNPCP